MASSFKKAICLGWLLALFSTVIWVAPVQAQGGFAMSGSFYSQKLELPQGTTLRTPDIYVVVFNNADEDINVKMSTNTPPGVTIILAEYEFPLAAHNQKKLDIGVDISMEAVPGDYTIGVTAEPYKTGGTGIQIVGGAGQDADLTITGDYGVVNITTLSPGGTPVPAMIYLYRTYDKDSFEIARTDTGELDLNVSPGDYITRAFIGGRQLAEESFSVAADEHKSINLSVKTVCFEGFEVVPVNQRDTGAVVMANVVCSINNLWDAFADVKVNLIVTSDTQQENVTILNTSRLERSQTEVNYNYVPSDGWQIGVYLFKLELEIGGQIYTTSQAKGLTIDKTGKASLTTVGGAIDTTPTATTTTTAAAATEEVSGSSFIWLIIVGIAVGVLVIVIAVILFIRKRM
ncbi:MAG: hypothetical protein JXA17_04315 [Dehalococcoidales bacterium]|nr:hypothetical protein [Dehalococcoidales bacterium]